MLGTRWHHENPDDLARLRDLNAMGAIGLSHVRVGEGGWSRLEPTPDAFDFSELDRVLDEIAARSLRAVLVLPFLKPPRWRANGSPPRPAADSCVGRADRTTLSPCVSITPHIQRMEALASALAAHVGTRVEAFALDASIASRCGCEACVESFLATRDALADEAPDPSEAGLRGPWHDDLMPPALRMAWRRFHSVRATALAQRMRGALAAHAPTTTLRLHVGEATPDVDLFALAAVADGGVEGACHPLPWSAHLSPQADPRAGHPDAPAFLHDLLRGAGRGRFHVAALQCGALDRGGRRAVPAPGMTRLWTWEALAHGAESVTYARWRESAAEGGLVHIDGEADQGFAEVARVAREMEFLRWGPPTRAAVALLYDAQARWAFEIEPWGVADAWLRLAFTFYEALRTLGLDVDVVSSQAMPTHALVVAPSLPIWPLSRHERVGASQALVLGPRTATRTATLEVDPEGIGEGRTRLRPRRGESVPQGAPEEVVWEGRRYAVGPWREWVAADSVPVARFTDGEGALYEAEGTHRIGFWPSIAFLVDYLETLCARLKIDTQRLTPELRLRRCGDLTFGFNASASQVAVPAPSEAAFFLGSRDVTGRSITAWRTPS